MTAAAESNVRSVVPFFCVADMQRSLRFYLDGLGCIVQHQWVVDDKVRWCWLKLGGAALMLQQFPTEGHDSWAPKGKVGEGVSLWFQCADALAMYDELRARSIDVAEPEVGNGQWDVVVMDPDGYVLHFDSPADAPEDTKLSQVRGGLKPAAG